MHCARKIEHIISEKKGAHTKCTHRCQKVQPLCTLLHKCDVTYIIIACRGWKDCGRPGRGQKCIKYCVHTK